MLGLTTLGLTIGAITDAIVNGIRNKKADKLEQQQKLVTEQ